MTSHSLNLANDVVNLTRQKAEIEQKILDAREEVENHLREIAAAAGMKEDTSFQNYLSFYWPNP